MENTFNKAKWIWKNTSIVMNDYAYFRKEIKIDKKIKQTIIHASAHNHMKIYVNGHIISGYVSPISSVATKTKYFLTYDITEFLIKGNNCLYVEVLYLGGKGQNYLNAAPGFILSGKIICQSKIIDIHTDETWKTARKTAHQINMPYQQNRLVTPVELFDARVYQVNAQLAHFDEQHWVSSVLSPMNLYQPKMKKQDVVEGGIHESIKPTKIGEQKIGIQVFDVGRIITGFVKLTLDGYEGIKITIRYSEDLIDNRVKHNVANETSENYCDFYIMNETLQQSWQADFTYKAFRYFEIENYPEDIDINQLEVKVCSTALDVIGYLHSNSYPMINQLYETAVHTQLNNTQGMLVDCPHREQAQYLGDSDLQAENLIYNFSNSYELIEKALQDFTDMQQEEGFFPFVAPTNFLGTQFEVRICEYDFYFILLMEKAYAIKGDKKILKEYYPVASKMLAHYISLIDQTGLIPKDKGWHISDWPYPTVDHSGDYLTFENMLALKTIRLMIKFGEILHVEKDYYVYLEKNLRSSIVKYFKKDGLFIDSWNSNQKHQGINAFALELNLFTDLEKKNAIDAIIEQKFASSVILGRTVLRQLFETEKTEEAFHYMFDYKKGWGSILRQGAQTMWEGFDNIESHSHAWNCYPLRLIQEYVVGIKFIEPQLIYIKPQFVDRVEDIIANIQTINGMLTFGYEISKDKMTFTYFIPDGLKVILAYQNNEYELKNNQKAKIYIKREVS